MTNAREAFRNKNLKQWEMVIKSIFPDEIPSIMEWSSKEDIIDVLNHIGEVEQLAHMFFPSGGGLDLQSAKHSVEKGCIEITADGLDHIVNPKKLSFFFFGENNYEWAYFRLETNHLNNSGVYEKYDNEFQYEEVTELSPGKYVDRSAWDAGYYGYDESGEKRLPRDARVVCRIFSGAFVFFAKNSIYNRVPKNYDAYHNKLTSEQFRKHISEVITYLAEKEKQ